MTPWMDRRTLLAGATGMAVPRAFAMQGSPLAGDWSAVAPADDRGGRQIVRMRIRPNGQVTGLAGARILAEGRIEEAPQTAVLAAEARSMTPDKVHILWPARDSPSFFAGRAAGPDRIDGAIALKVNGGESIPLSYERGAVPKSLTLPPLRLTDAGLEASRQLLDLPALVAGGQRRGAEARYWRTGERWRGGGLVQPGDRFMLGSCTKSLTSTLVARLVEAGQIGWDDRIGDVLGSKVQDIRPEYRDLTYRHLLSHRAGIERDAGIAQLFMARQLYARDPIAARLGMARDALRRAPAAKAEAVEHYSNLGYAVAGSMMEAKLGVSWDELIRRHVFEPLGLASAGIGPPRGDQPRGHNGNRPMPPDDPNSDNPYGPPGKTHMSLEDMLKYLQAHRDRGPFLRQESWKTLHTPPFGGAYAMGWLVLEDGRLFHNGSNGFWYTVMYVGADRVGAAMTNRGEDIGRIALQAFNAV